MDTFTMCQALGQTQHLILSSQAHELHLQAHFTDEDVEIWHTSYGLQGREQGFKHKTPKEAGIFTPAFYLLLSLGDKESKRIHVTCDLGSIFRDQLSNKARMLVVYGQAH